MPIPENFKVDFVVAGFSKCGTTTLHSLLGEHPQLCMSTEKEPQFFAYPRSDADWRSYRGLFAHAQPGQRLGESSTFYTAHTLDQFSARQIRAHNPGMRVILLCRDPVRRIESSFREFHHSAPRYGHNTPFCLAEALRTLPALIEDSKFHSRSAALRAQFPDEQILVLRLEDLHADPAAVLTRCYRFLGVDPSLAPPSPPRTLNAGETKLQDSRTLRWLRTTAPFGQVLSWISIDTQERLFRPVGLRRLTSRHARWPAEAKQMVRSGLKDDIAAFVERYRLGMSGWDSFQRLLGDPESLGDSLNDQRSASLRNGVGK